MLAIMMAGGRGSRMRSGEKPMLRVRGRPMAARVLDALVGSGCFDRILAVVSMNTPRTAAFLAEKGVTVMESSGRSYVDDLSAALQAVKPERAFIVPCDLPLLDSVVVRNLVGLYDNCKKPCLTAMVGRSLLDELGVGADYCVEHNGRTVCNSGISIIDSSRVSALDVVEEELTVMDDIRIALNVNTAETLELAEKILAESRPDPAA